MQVSKVSQREIPIPTKPAASWRSLAAEAFKEIHRRAMDSLFPASLLPQDPSLKMKRLDNGLTYYVRKNAYPIPGKATFHLVVKAGMCEEREEERGIAHLIEHITKIETRHFKKNEIFDFLNSKGVKWGEGHQAYTSDTKTVYKFNLPLSDPEMLDKAFFILSEVASSAALSDEIIEQERKIVIDELKFRNQPILNYCQAKAEILFAGTPYASLLDRKKEIESVKTCSAETIRDFYRNWYRPDNIAVMAVGDFNPDEVSHAIEKYFGKIPSSKEPLSKKNIELSMHGGTKILSFSHPELSDSLVEIYHQLPELKRTGALEKKEIVQNLKINLFSQIFNQRLEDLAEESDAPFIRASCSYQESIPNWPGFALSLKAKEGQIPLAFRHLLIEIKRLKTFGFTHREFEQAKKRLLARLDSLLLEKGKTKSSDFIATYHNHFMENQAAVDLDEKIALTRKILEEIDLAAINSLSPYLFSKDNALVATASPKKQGVQGVTPEELKREIAYVAKEKPAPFFEEVVDSSLLEKLPLPVKVEGIRKHEKIGATEYLLKNGLRVVLKPTTFENDLVSLTALSFHGIRDANPKEIASSRFAKDFFDHCGVGRFDLKALNKVLHTKVVNIRTAIEPYTTVIKASSTIKDFETLLQLLHLLFTEPRYDRIAFEKAMQKMQEKLANAKNNPDFHFVREWVAAITQNHPEMKPLDYDDLKKVNYEASKKCHRFLYSNPADFSLAIVGNIQEEKAKELIERYLATIPGNGNKSPRRDYPSVPFPSGISRKDVMVGSQTGSLSLLTFPAPIQDTFRERCLSVWCCSLLENRLQEVLRLKMGKTYVQECSFIHPEVQGLNPGNSSKAVIGFTCDPSDFKLLEAKAIEEIRDLQTNGPTEKEIRNLKIERESSYSDQRRTNGGWMQILLANFQWNPKQDNFEEIQSKELKSLTRSAVQEQFKKIFPLHNYSVVNKIPKNS